MADSKKSLKKTPKRPKKYRKYNWPEIEKMMIVLARVGYDKTKQIARILGIPPSTLLTYFKKNPEFSTLIKYESTKFTGYLLTKTMQQVEKGYWPAIQYLLERQLKKVDNELEKFETREDLNIEINFVEKENANENN